jgi:hypothetical protein
VRRRGRLAGVSAVIGDLAATVQRARDARANYVRLYDPSGHGTTLVDGSTEAKAALEAANHLLNGLAETRKLEKNKGKGA